MDTIAYVAAVELLAGHLNAESSATDDINSLRGRAEIVSDDCQGSHSYDKTLLLHGLCTSAKNII